MPCASRSTADHAAALRPLARTAAVLLLLTCAATALQATGIPPLADSAHLGAGTPGTTGVPKLAVLGLPVVGDPGPGLALVDGLPGAPAQLLIGLGGRPVGQALPAQDATLWVGPAFMRLPLVLDAQGRSPVLHSGPAAVASGWLGLEVSVQGLVLDAGATGGLAFTAGRRLTFGAGRAAAALFRERYVQFFPEGGSLHAAWALADLDGNGRPDLVTAAGSGASLQLEVRRQLRDGSMAPAWPARLGGGGAVVDLAAGDGDGDGLIDIAGLRTGLGAHPAAALWMRGLGDGDLAAPLVRPLPVGNAPAALRQGDVTGDGRADLVVAGWTATQVAVLAGGPLGPDAVPVAVLDLPAPTVLRGLALADLDADGRLDIVVLCGGATPRVVVARSLGGGAFAPAVPHAAGLDEVSCLAVSDLDGDGHLDVLVGSPDPLGSEQLARLPGLGNGLGGLGPAQPFGWQLPAMPFPLFLGVNEVTLADATGDGLPEAYIVTRDSNGSPTGGPVLRLPNDAGVLGPGALLVPMVSTRLAVLDMLPDRGPGAGGHIGLDLAAFNLEYGAFGATFVAYPLATDGSVGEPQPAPDFAPTVTRAGDLDGDGVLDLVGRTSGITLSVVLGDGHGGFGPPTVSGMVGSVRDLVLADLDGDGHLDVVVAGSGAPGGVVVFPGLGDGSLGPPVAHAPGVASRSVRCADVTGDGWLDVVTAADTVAMPTDELMVLPSLGGGAFGAPVFTPVDVPLRLFELADFDGDGHLDALLQGQLGLRLLPGTGTGHFGPAVFLPNNFQGALDAPLTAADLDGDGDIDVVRQTLVFQLQVWLNDGAGHLAVAHTEWSDVLQGLAVGDLNGDGAVDIACRGVMLGYGDGSFAPRQPGGAAGALGDFDLDGDLDAASSGLVFLNRSY